MKADHRGQTSWWGEHLECSPCGEWRVVSCVSRLAGPGGIAVALVVKLGLYQSTFVESHNAGILSRCSMKFEVVLHLLTVSG